MALGRAEQDPGSCADSLGSRLSHAEARGEASAEANITAGKFFVT